MPRNGHSASVNQMPAVTYFATRYLMLPVRRASERFLLRNAESLQHDGFTLYETTGREQSSEVLVQLKRALQLIEELDPCRYSRMRRDMPRIAIAERGGARYWYATRTGVVDHPLVHGRSAATIAVMLVNVAARARVMNTPLGRKLPPVALQRLAHLAVKAQIAFANKLPQEDHPGLHNLLAHLHQQLARYTPSTLRRR